ncbi:OmpP1/FadL family transporter [Marinobacter xestospongiae]|uniref:OmpP1/FadL family transporter n=1 Tax=Marinobacter xestospongiae TaxID=994319 RepID=UPI0020052172|nr:outer membrane protein transport protein [Marinobacter xestospongiae]MCK7568630.1 outer membrane protein transport protein [Marinobacter xestospongiae]
MNRRNLAYAATAFLTANTEVTAAGFELKEHSSNGLGRAFAGQAVILENSSILPSNAAAIAMFDASELSLFGSYIDPNIDSEGEVTNTVGPNEVTTDASDSEVSDGAIVPAVFYTTPLNDKWSLGLGIFANFGLSTEYSEDYNALHFADRSEITSTVINPTVAYKVSDDLSVGLGVSATYAEASLSTSVPASLAAATGGLVPSGGKIVDMEGDDWGVGWNVGVFWQALESTSLGLSYRSKTKLKLSGEIESDIVSDYNQSASLDLELPAMAELAINHHLSPSLSVQSSVGWTEWSSFDHLDIDLSDGNLLPLREENFDDSFRYSASVTYRLNDLITLRGGYAFDEGAAPEDHRSLSIPDTDRQWLTAGATFDLDSASSIDVGVAYIKGKGTVVNEHAALGPETSRVEASQSSKANIFSVQYNTRF